MALVASANGGESRIQQQQSSQRRQSSSTMDPPRVERAPQLDYEYSSLVGVSSSADSPERFNGSPNRQREMDLLAAAAMKSEEYRQLFRLPPGEVLVQDFSYALQENILCQHLFASLSRDEAYNLLSDLCPDCENSVKGGSRKELIHRCQWLSLSQHFGCKYSPSESSSRICESLATNSPN